jgi:pilus assembly protein CpaB
MKNRRAIRFLLLSVGCGLITMFAFRNYVSQTKVANLPTAVVVTEPVVVAAFDLKAGVEIKSSQLEIKEWPVDFLPKGTFSGLEPIDKRIPKHTITAGEPILNHTLLPPGSNAGLGSLIQDDHRAMSVRVDEVVGVAGFVKPDSRVDVLVTLKLVREGGKPTSYSRTILQNVRVLAIDQSMEAVPGSKPLLVSVVTLQVSPKEAQILSFGSVNGRLSLAMRNPVDGGHLALPGTTQMDLMDVIDDVVDDSEEVATGQPKRVVEMVRGAALSRELL